MIPDRFPDTARTGSTVADEIACANVIRLERQGKLWRAVVGPDATSGIYALGDTPRRALVHLAIKAEALGWTWDETWREPTL